MSETLLIVEWRQEVEKGPYLQWRRPPLTPFPSPIQHSYRVARFPSDKTSLQQGSLSLALSAASTSGVWEWWAYVRVKLNLLGRVAFESTISLWDEGAIIGSEPLLLANRLDVQLTITKTTERDEIRVSVTGRYGEDGSWTRTGSRDLRRCFNGRKQVLVRPTRAFEVASGVFGEDAEFRWVKGSDGNLSLHMEV